MALAEYSATSAQRSSPSTVDTWSGDSPMPTEQPTVSTTPCTRYGCRMASPSRRARSTACSASSLRRTSTTNSSPPRRATRSLLDACSSSRSATATSSSSPTACPSVSLTSLKWSRSMRSSATVPVDRSSARSVAVVSSVRLASPVRGSRRASCSRCMVVRPLRCSATIGTSSRITEYGVHSAACAASGPSPSRGAEVISCQVTSSVSTFHIPTCSRRATAAPTRPLLITRNAAPAMIAGSSSGVAVGRASKGCSAITA